MPKERRQRQHAPKTVDVQYIRPSTEPKAEEVPATPENNELGCIIVIHSGETELIEKFKETREQLKHNNIKWQVETLATGDVEYRSRRTNAPFLVVEIKRYNKYTQYDDLEASVDDRDNLRWASERDRMLEMRVSPNEVSVVLLIQNPTKTSLSVVIENKIILLDGFHFVRTDNFKETYARLVVWADLANNNKKLRHKRHALQTKKRSQHVDSNFLAYQLSAIDGITQDKAMAIQNWLADKYKVEQACMRNLFDAWNECDTLAEKQLMLAQNVKGVLKNDHTSIVPEHEDDEKEYITINKPASKRVYDRYNM
jgi:hypothetical protein